MSYPSGELVRLTNDLNTYEGVSLAANRSSLVTSRNEYRVGIWIGNATATTGSEVAPPRLAAQIGFGLAWSGSDIIYTYSAGGPPSIARLVPGRETPEEIAPRATNPSASKDGETIVYLAADGQGSWRIDRNGRNRTQLTGIQTSAPVIMPNGRAVIVPSFSNGRQSLHVMPIEGGSAAPITDLPSIGRPAISSDGKSIVFASMDDQGRPITMVCDMPTCTSRRTLPPMNEPRWMPDRRGIGFIDTTTQSNIWVQPLDGSSPRQLTHLPTDESSLTSPGHLTAPSSLSRARPKRTTSYCSQGSESSFTLVRYRRRTT